MADITIHGPVQATDGGSALRITVRGCEVLALFAPVGNSDVYQRIRGALLDSCITSFSSENTEKIGQNAQNMR